MTEPEQTPPGEDAFQSNWLRVLDGLVGGIHHALNNRVAALGAVGQVLENEIPSDSPLRAILRQELERIRDTNALLASLPRNRRGAAEPVQIGDLLPELRSLYGIHHELRDLPLTVHSEEGALPVWTEPARLLHTLLVLSAAAGRVAQARAGGEVQVRAGGDPERTWVEVAARGDEAPAEVALYREGLLEEVEAEGVDAWAAAAGGELRTETGGGDLVRFRLELPTLLAVRRRESGS